MNRKTKAFIFLVYLLIYKYKVYIHEYHRGDTKFPDTGFNLIRIIIFPIKVYIFGNVNTP